MRTCSLSFIQICLMLSLSLSTTSYAVERPFPANAKAGEMTVSANRSLTIDDKVKQLAAGAQIRNQHNMIVQPQTLVTQLGGRLAGLDVPVLYTENNHGQIHRLWILTKEELEKYPADEDDAPPPPMITPNRSATSPGTPAPNRTAIPGITPPNRTARSSN